uniref:Uncharacterized protein n=1 Tax=Rhizophora mucronata TaxID=61149 RepID=A0A2P2P872_RHIMU
MHQKFQLNQNIDDNNKNKQEEERTMAHGKSNCSFKTPHASSFNSNILGFPLQFRKWKSSDQGQVGTQ